VEVLDDKLKELVGLNPNFQQWIKWKMGEEHQIGSPYQ
jgi:hypothetical protein